MMRFVASLAMLSLATLSLAAQRDRSQPGADELVTIRGCLHDGRVLRANEPQHQTPASRNWVAKDQRFALSGDRAIMEELQAHVRHEVDITGLLEVLDGPSLVAVEPPLGPRGRLPVGPQGRLPGLPTDPFARPPAGASQGFTLYLDPDRMGHLMVTGYEHVGLSCRQ